MFKSIALVQKSYKCTRIYTVLLTVLCGPCDVLVCSSTRVVSGLRCLLGWAGLRPAGHAAYASHSHQLLFAYSSHIHQLLFQSSYKLSSTSYKFTSYS